MLDVHPPHERIHGIRDFLLHLLTITIGLLIALGLEAWVEHVHHNQLRDEAIKDLNHEIADNRKELAGTMALIVKDKADLNSALPYLDMAKPNGSVHIGLNLSNLSNASWSTASATGALSFMDYDKVQRYAGIYQRQTDFQALQNKVFTDFLSSTAHVSAALSSDGDAKAKYQAKQDVALTLGELDVMQQVGKALDGAYGEVLK